MGNKPCSKEALTGGTETQRECSERGLAPKIGKKHIGHAMMWERGEQIRLRENGGLPTNAGARLGNLDHIIKNQ